MVFFMFHFCYAVGSEKYVGWLRGMRKTVSMPRSLSLKAKTTALVMNIFLTVLKTLTHFNLPTAKLEASD